MFYSTYQKKSPEVEQLEWELEQAREGRRQWEEEQERQREARQREREENYYYLRRTAETWPEALRKQMALFADEAAQWTDELDNYFGPGADACNRALEIWRQVESSKQAKITELRRQLEAVQDEIRLEVAKQLSSENNVSSWRHVANAIEENEDLENWLNW